MRIQTHRQQFAPNILQANCLLLSHTQLYLQPLSENTGSITHERGLACSYSVSMDLIVELLHPSLTLYLYFPRPEVITVFQEGEDFTNTSVSRAPFALDTKHSNSH